VRLEGLCQWKIPVIPRYENNVGLNKGIKELGCEDLDWVNLADDRIRAADFCNHDGEMLNFIVNGRPCCMMD
jgi:hypothetical protein